MEKETENLLARIQKLGQLTPSEAKIAEYFRRHYPKSAFETATRISRETSTSKATVVRFISRLGYSNYAEFHSQLQSDIMSRLESPVARFPSTKKRAEASGSDFLGLNISHIINNLQATATGIDRNQFNEISRLLANEESKIFIIGQRTSYGPAHSLWILLRYLRKDVFLISGQASTVVEEIEDAKPEDTLVVISHRRYSRQSIQIAEYFRKIGSTIITLVDMDQNPYSKLSTIQLVTPTFGLNMFDSTCATIALIESLILEIARLREENIYDRIDSTEKLFDHFTTFSS
ncbi:MAG: MurR/RpiR family transcriptional regulator [Proteobacteria bacterium]|nr:MurR/RpiR family transcriptional regulator [Pseudomonadota bacterium]